MNTATNSNKAIKRSIILCWVALALCFVIKICGGNFFSIAVESERFIAVCEYIDKHCIRIVQFANYSVLAFIYYCATFRVVKPDLKQFAFIVLAITSSFIIKIFNVYVGGILEMIFMVVLPIAIAKEKWYKPLIYLALYYVFGYVSIFVKNICCPSLPSNTLIGLIFSLDVYFMTTLFMLYNRKEVK